MKEELPWHGMPSWMYRIVVLLGIVLGIDTLYDIGVLLHQYLQ